jgi:DNA-binding IclR family transcriptional regulator
LHLSRRDEDVLEAITSEPKPAAIVAQASGYSEESVRQAARILKAMGLIDQRGKGYFRV